MAVGEGVGVGLGKGRLENGQTDFDIPKVHCAWNAVTHKKRTSFRESNSGCVIIGFGGFLNKLSSAVFRPVLGITACIARACFIKRLMN